MVVQSRGWEKSPGEGNGNHFSILAWEIPWTEGPGRLHAVYWVVKELDMNLVTKQQQTTTLLLSKHNHNSPLIYQ